ALHKADVVVSDREIVAHALDSRDALDDPERFFALELVGHRAGQLGRPVLEHHMDVVVSKVPALPQMVGNGVGHLLVCGRLLRGAENLALFDAKLARLVGGDGADDRQPQNAGGEVSSSHSHDWPPPGSDTRIKFADRRATPRCLIFDPFPFSMTNSQHFPYRW